MPVRLSAIFSEQNIQKLYLLDKCFVPLKITTLVERWSGLIIQGTSSNRRQISVSSYTGYLEGARFELILSVVREISD